MPATSSLHGGARSARRPVLRGPRPGLEVQA